jgi:hypothetical protein
MLHILNHMLKFLMVALLLAVIVGVLDSYRERFTPAQIVTKPYPDDGLTLVLTTLHAPKERIPEMESALRLASNRTGIDGKLLAVLVFTESNFKKRAVSGKGYKGLLQTPSASFFTDVDILYGARILKEKLRLTRGDLFEALALYKGGDGPLARKQANRVLEIYRTL